MNIQEIKISQFNYPLPDQRIAKFPMAERDHSKLLLYRHGQVSEDVFYNLPQYLPKGALMVFNNTKVIQARLHFRKSDAEGNPTGALIEIFLLEPIAPADYEQMFQTTGECTWHCLVGNLKKWKGGELKREVEINGEKVAVFVTKSASFDGQNVCFRWTNDTISFAEIINAIGELPIPPYLNWTSLY